MADANKKDAPTSTGEDEHSEVTCPKKNEMMEVSKEVEDKEIDDGDDDSDCSEEENTEESDSEEDDEEMEEVATGTTKLACLEECLPGKKHGCPNRRYNKPCHDKTKSCHEVERILNVLGVDPETASKCIKAAIMRGHIDVNGEEGELDMVVLEGKGECGHILKAKLGDVLKQPDYAGLDYADGLQNATVVCNECDQETIESGVGRAYVTGLCSGKPRFDFGKFHNHCKECPGFGTCIYDYRNCHNDCCGDHMFIPMFGHQKGEAKCYNRKCMVFKKWQANKLKKTLPAFISRFKEGPLTEDDLKTMDEHIKEMAGASPHLSEESSSGSDSDY